MRQLRGFHKITLAPGETRTVHFRLGPDELGVYVQAGGEGELGFSKVVEPGSFTVSTDSGLEVTPLVQSSEQSGNVSAATLQFAQPDEVARQITPSGRKTLAALLRGKFKTAFPNGAPAATPATPSADAGLPPCDVFLRPSSLTAPIP